MKGLGVIMTIVGAILGIIGYIKCSSWEYQLASAYGLGGSGVKVMLCGGIALLVLGLILLFAGGRSEKGNSDQD